MPTKKQLQEENQELKRQNALLKEILQESRILKQMGRETVNKESSFKGWIV